MTALKDFISALLNWRLWTMLAIDDWRLRYHRTLLGPVWILLSFGAFILVKVVVFTNLSAAEADFFSAYLTIGFFVWLYIQQCMNEGSMALVKNRNWILGISAPLSLHVLANSLIQALNMAFTYIATILIVAWVYPFDLMNLVPTTMGMLLIGFSMFWLQLFLAIISVFMRDLIQLVQTFSRMMLFLTPIFWLPEQFGPEPPIFYTWNPFTYYLNLIRDLMFTGTTDMLTVQVVSGCTLVLMVVSMLALGVTARRIPAYI